MQPQMSNYVNIDCVIGGKNALTLITEIANWNSYR